MQITQSNDNLNFRSKFNFINANKFFELAETKGNIEVEMDKGFKKVDKGGKIYSVCLGPCTGHAITNKNLKEAVAGHFSFFADGIKKHIENTVNQVRSFVIGGDINFLSEFFEKDIEEYRNKIPTTIFWGQEKGSSNFLYDANKDTCYIYKSSGEHYEDSEFVDSVEKLKKAYKIINIAKGDEVLINGKKIDSKLVNQNTFNNKIYSWNA